MRSEETGESRPGSTVSSCVDEVEWELSLAYLHENTQRLNTPASFPCVLSYAVTNPTGSDGGRRYDTGLSKTALKAVNP